MAYLSFKSKLGMSLTMIVVLVLLTGSSASPVSGGINNAITYLSRYGYLSPSLQNTSIGHMVDEGTIRRAIAEFQSFFRLKATGELNEETVRMMSLPRCGMPDKVFGQRRAKRYALVSNWSKRKLTYRITKYPFSKLSYHEVDAELARAFSVWTRYTDLTFRQKRSGYTDIDIRFVKGDHGDGIPFDGPAFADGTGGVLAHAFFPENGNVHFDETETWTIQSNQGINLFQVAVHEFGHALGLEHSDISSAVMFPTYNGFNRNFQLDRDDIEGIQDLYGSKYTGRRNNNFGWGFDDRYFNSWY